MTAYSLDGKLIASTDFVGGEDPCPPTYPPATGNPPGGSIGMPPGNPFPSFPSYPSYPSYPSDGGGSSGGGNNQPSEGCDNPNTYVLVDIIMDYGDGSGLGEYINDCGWVMYEAVAYLSANARTSAKLTSPCDEGSDIVILPFPIKNPAPCDQVKIVTSNVKFKNNITDLEGKTGLENEAGYRMDYPVAGQSGIINQLLQNKPRNSRN
ncbi:hypothetical protein [Chryseobacterium wangxinyae]|uniref:hypothetical protein n=1 Tax=Chryseobacterium sp. CY353 TaxID=2997334 RepID=UPI0022711B20|nr:hypothetical protein [Chryseobacterium sp. CY353]MCY0968748.1 hypothetical protein [Chryseobacterium sp. CY353]